MGNKFLVPPSIPVLSDPPPDPEDGYLYYDTTLFALRIYLNNTWNNIVSPNIDTIPVVNLPGLPGLPRPGPIPSDPNSVVPISVIPYSLASTALTTVTLTANEARFIPFYIKSMIRITRVDINVSTASAGTIQIGIYESSPSHPYTPITLLYVATDVDTSSTGNKSVTELTWDLYPGIYWMAIWSSGTPTVRAVPVNSLFPLTTDLTSDDALNNHYVATDLSSGLPSLASSWFSPSNSAFPAIAVQYTDFLFGAT